MGRTADNMSSSFHTNRTRTNRTHMNRTHKPTGHFRNQQRTEQAGLAPAENNRSAGRWLAQPGGSPDSSDSDRDSCRMPWRAMCRDGKADRRDSSPSHSFGACAADESPPMTSKNIALARSTNTQRVKKRRATTTPPCDVDSVKRRPIARGARSAIRNMALAPLGIHIANPCRYNLVAWNKKGNDFHTTDRIIITIAQVKGLRMCGFGRFAKCCCFRPEWTFGD